MFEVSNRVSYTFYALSTLVSLTKLLTKSILLLSGCRWLSDTPLKMCAFLYGDITAVFISHLMSDSIHRSYFYNRYTYFLRFDSDSRHSHSALQELLQLFISPASPVQWTPLLQRYMSSDFNNEVPPSDLNISSRLRNTQVDS